MKVTLEKLTKKFPSQDRRQKGEVTAVDNFDIVIPDGKLVGLLGPSGCGKSTTLHLLSGLQKPTSGSIFFDEDDVTNVPPENRGVGLVFQNYALYPHLTVRQNILFPLENLRGEAKLTKEAMEERAMEAAKLVQIDGLMGRKPSELSGGQQQRVAIARALVKLPRLLLLDEPLSNLDARLRLQTREEIRRIQRKTGITTVFVTHDQEEAMSISDFIIVMREGLIHQVGKPQEVYDSPIDLFVAKFLGTPPINVFRAKVKDGELYIGEEKVQKISGVSDRELYAAIRPEGFILKEDGALGLKLTEVEVMGRDITVVSSHPDCENVDIRSIISAENDVPEGAEEVRFDIKPNKLFLFDIETEERIHFAEEED